MQSTAGLAKAVSRSLTYLTSCAANPSKRLVCLFSVPLQEAFVRMQSTKALAKAVSSSLTYLTLCAANPYERLFCLFSQLVSVAA
jgi:hypothetical protein